MSRSVTRMYINYLGAALSSTFVNLFVSLLLTRDPLITEYILRRRLHNLSFPFLFVNRQTLGARYLIDKTIKSTFIYDKKIDYESKYTNVKIPMWKELCKSVYYLQYLHFDADYKEGLE